MVRKIRKNEIYPERTPTSRSPDREETLAPKFSARTELKKHVVGQIEFLTLVVSFPSFLHD